MMRSRIRNALLIVSAVAIVWAMAASALGGFSMRAGKVRLSSRSSLPALTVAVGVAVAALLLTTRDERRAARALTWAAPDRLDRVVRSVSPYIGVAAAVAVVVLGLTRGVFEAGGADSYGYVSQAELWTRGLPVMESPLAKDPRWRHSIEMLIPLGYRSGPNQTIVPMYAPGLPLMMALAQRVAGREAVFIVVPLLGGLAVLATYLIGARLVGPFTGAAAAVLAATSPPFLFQLLKPMSDVPVAAWWTLAWAAVMRPSRTGALLGGIATSLAILTRPNLAPLTAVPVVWLWWQSRIGASPQLTKWRVAAFLSAVVPGCVAVALVNHQLYGSPFESGYAPLLAYYSWVKLIPNLRRYPAWLFETQTPAVLLACLAPLAIARIVPADERRRARSTTVAWLMFIAGVFASYLFYTVFNDWWYLRFVLPALPPLLVLTVVSIDGLNARFLPRARVLATCVLTLALAWHGLTFAAARGTFGMKDAEHRAAAVGDYIAGHFPERAAFIAFEQSGSANYYSGRQTLMFEAIPADALQTVLDDLRQLGYHPYFLLENWEEPVFKNQFAGHCKCAWLDWPPRAEYVHGIRVRIYDPADRDDPAARRREPDNIYAR
jgi:hypothetical protein